MKNFRCVVLACVSFVLAACASPAGMNYSGSDFGSEGAWVRSVRNVVYDPAHGLALDIYAPRRATDAPLVVFFGGERWARGDKADYGFVGEALASQGFVAMVANYRFYPPATYTQFLGDCARAVVWAQQNASQYGASANKIFVMGYSAGAYNAAMLALDPEFLQAAGSRTPLAGMIGISGPYNFLPITAADLRAIFWPPSDFNKTQPTYWARRDAPPMLLLASRANQVANPADTEALFAAVKAAGGTIEEVLYDNLSHRDTLTVLATGAQTRADEMKNIVSFVHRTLAKAAARRAAAANSGIRTQPSPMLPAMTITPEQLPAPVPLPAPDTAPGDGSGFQPVQ